MISVGLLVIRSGAFMFFPFNGTLASRYFWLAVSIITVFVSCGYAWKRFRPEFVSQSQYQISAATIRTTPVPDYLQIDVNAEVLPEIEKQHITLLDRNVLTDVAEAYLQHRCVAGVYSVRKSARQIQCEIEYHRPAAAIEVADGMNRRSVVPITADNVMMEPRDLSVDALERLIRIELPGISREGMFAGETIENETIARSAALAGMLSQQEGLDSVVRIQQQNQLSESLFLLQLKNGTRVVWGSMNAEASAAEVSDQDKIAALKQAIESYGNSQSETDFRDLDIRSGKPRRVIPQTAVLP